MMQYDGFDLDVESILECPEKGEFDIVQGLATFTREFRSRVAATIETYLAQEKEYVEKSEAIAKRIAQLHSAKKETAIKLDNIILQRKVEDKKMAIAAKQQTKLREEIEERKACKERISLEMVDLTQELEDGRKLRKDRWNAIKMACSVYKNNLNFHIDYTDCKDHERVKVTFFRHKNPNRDSYYVTLLNYKDSWKVNQIEPELKEIHLEELKTTVDIRKPLDVLDVIVLLCKLRNIFFKTNAL